MKLLLFLLLCAPSVLAQPTLTLGQAVERALAYHPALLDGENILEVEQAQVAMQRRSFWPELSLAVGSDRTYGTSFSQEEARLIDQASTRVSGGLLADMVLFDGQARANTLQAARHDVASQRANLARLRQAAVLDATEQYITVLRQQNHVAVKQRQFEEQQRQQQLIAALAEVGEKPISDSYQQQAATAAAQVAVVEAQQTVQVARLQLYQTLQLDPLVDYAFVDPEAVENPLLERLDASLDALLAQAEADRDDLRQQREALRAAEAEERAARSIRWPVLSLYGSYTSAFADTGQGAFDSQLGQNRRASLGVSMNFPLLNNRTGRQRIDQAILASSRTQLQADQARQAVRSEVYQAYQARALVEAKYTAAQAGRQAARQAVAAAQARYTVGEAPFIELASAQVGLVEAEATWVEARYEVLLYEHRLAFVVGEEAP